MKKARMLLPFTYGVHLQALEYAVLLAESRNAILVVLSLVHIPFEQRTKGARLEHIQQSKDFLVAVQHKAARHAVPVEQKEVYTSDVVQSISTVAQEMNCEYILLFVRDGNAILLHTHEVKHIMTQVDSKLLIVRLPSSGRKNLVRALLKRFSNVLSKQSSNAFVQK